MTNRQPSKTRTGNDEPESASQPRRKSAAIFLDRDGTITEEMGYINHIDRAKLFPWAAEAIRKLNGTRLPVIVVTNQSGVGRGYFTENLVVQIHQRIQDELAAQDAHVDAFYYCPHHPSASISAYRQDCKCRKPATGMVDEAAQRFGIDPRASYIVGDSYRDMQLGFNAGMRTAMLMTGYGRGEYANQRSRWDRMPDLISENLLEAAGQILEELNAATPAKTRSTSPHL